MTPKSGGVVEFQLEKPKDTSLQSNSDPFKGVGVLPPMSPQIRVVMVCDFTALEAQSVLISY